MDNEWDWIGTSGAARLLGVQVRTVYRFIEDGRLPAYRFGRVIRVARADLDKFIISCRIEPAQSPDLCVGGRVASTKHG